MLLALIDDIRALAPFAAGSYLHGERHWCSVGAVGARLIGASEPADPLVVFLFALLHDSQRVNDERDPDHGPRAARLAEELRGVGALPPMSAAQFETLVRALEGHTGGRPVNDPTVGVCWDADRLNLPRVGKTVDASWISTHSAQDETTKAWAAGLHDAPPTWEELLRALGLQAEAAEQGSEGSLRGG